jgi:hypothetical protein
MKQASVPSDADTACAFFLRLNGRGCSISGVRGRVKKYSHKNLLFIFPSTPTAAAIDVRHPSIPDR